MPPVSLFHDDIFGANVRPDYMPWRATTDPSGFGFQTFVVRGMLTSQRASEQVNPQYIVDSEEAYVTYLIFSVFRMNFRLADVATATQTPSEQPGPELTDYAESNLALAIQGGGETIKFLLPDLIISDPTEPYSWDVVIDSDVRAAIANSSEAKSIIFDTSIGGVDYDTLTYNTDVPIVAVTTLTSPVAGGSSQTISGTFSDLQGNATVTVTASATLGTLGPVTQNNGAGTWSVLWTAPGSQEGLQDGTFTVTGTDSDNNVGTRSRSFQVSGNTDLWVIDSSGDDLWRIDPANPSRATDGYGRVGGFPTGLTTATGITSHDGDLWVIDDSGDELWRINPANPGDTSGVYGLVGDFNSALTSPQGMASLDGDLWIAATSGSDELWRINPANPGDTSGVYGNQGNFTTGLQFPLSLTSHDGDLWATDNTGDQLYRINPANAGAGTGVYGLVGSLAAGNDTPTGLTSLAGDLWVTDTTGDELWRVNPADPVSISGVYGDQGDLPAGLDNPTGMTAHSLNAPPTVTFTAPASPVDGGATQTISGSFSDPEGNATATISVAATRGTVSNVTQNNGAGNWSATWTAPARTGAQQTATLTATATDDGGLAATASRNVTIRANASPTVTFNTPTSPVDGGNTQTIRGNFSDPNGNATVTVTVAASRGTISNVAKNNAAGTWSATWTAPARTGAQQTATFTVTATDDFGLTATASRNVTIRANAPPTVTFNATTSPVDGGDTQTIRGSFSDPDGNATVTVTVAASRGTISNVTKNNAAGTWSATWVAPARTGAAQTATITATATDDLGLTDTASRNVTTRANASPTVTFTSLPGIVDGSLIRVLSGAFSDPDGNATATVTVAATRGTLGAVTQNNGAGTWSVQWTTPASTASQQDVTFTVTVTDDVGATATATRMTTVRAIQAPDEPNAPSVTSTGTSSISATFSAANTGDAADTLDLRWREGTTGNWTEIIGVNSPRSITGLTDGALHQVAVRGVNLGGNGAWSDPPGSATTDSADLMPTIGVVADSAVEQGTALSRTLPAATGGDLPVTYTLTGRAVRNDLQFCYPCAGMACAVSAQFSRANLHRHGHRRGSGHPHIHCQIIAGAL